MNFSRDGLETELLLWEIENQGWNPHRERTEKVQKFLASD